MTPVTQNMIYFWQGVRKQKPESLVQQEGPRDFRLCDLRTFTSLVTGNAGSHSSVITCPLQNTQAIFSQVLSDSQIVIQQPFPSCLLPCQLPSLLLRTETLNL